MQKYTGGIISQVGIFFTVTPDDGRVCLDESETWGDESGNSQSAECTYFNTNLWGSWECTGDG